MLEKIKQLFKKPLSLKKFGRSKVLRVHPDSPRPDRDWLIFLVVFVLLIILVGGYSYNLFFTVVHGDLADHDSENGVIEKIDQEELEKAVEHFRGKRKEYFDRGGIELPTNSEVIVVSEEITVGECFRYALLAVD